MADIRESAEAIEVRIVSLRMPANIDALRAVSYHAGRAAVAAAKIVRIANDDDVGWEDAYLTDEDEEGG